MIYSASLARSAAIAILFHGFVASTPALAEGNRRINLSGQAIPAATPGPIETDGTLDLLFDAGNCTNGSVSMAALQPDGRMLIGGGFSQVHGVTRLGLARLNTDGTLDLSFDPGDTALTTQSIALQPDGRIITFGGLPGLARLNSDGSRDNSFNAGRVISLDGVDDGTGGAVNPGIVTSGVLQADGKIVVVGRFFYIITGAGSVPRSCIARFNSDGTFDPSYNPGSGFVYSTNPSLTSAFGTVVQSLGANNEKIIVQGQFDTFDDQPAFGLVRLNTDGSFDNTFYSDAGVTDAYSISGLFAQSDDQIVVFGSFTSFRGIAYSGIVRLDSSGGVDDGFSPAVFQFYGDVPFISAVAQQPNGKLILGGFFHSLGGLTANNVVRLETTGARDASFDGAAAGPSAFSVNTILVRPSDGKILVGGNFSTYGGAPRNNIAWVNSDGSVDTAFTGLSGALGNSPHIYALGTQADGKILVGGSFSSFNGASHYNIVRLNPDSTLDPSFDATLGTCGSVRALLIQPDGKILIAGGIRAVDGVARARIARLNSDGTLDLSFDPGTGANDFIYALALDATGNIYVGGAFTSFNGALPSGIAKLSPTGTLDPAFNPSGGGTNFVVYAITPPDGTGGIVIGGSFTTYGTNSVGRIARLNAMTGALDTAFNPGGAGFNGSVRALKIAPDGKYYAGGSFISFNGAPRHSVARLNSNGSLDETFAKSVGPSVYSLALQNGKVFAGTVNQSSNPPPPVVRLTSSGEPDPSFAIGTVSISPPNTFPFAWPEVTALAIQPDGKLLLGGRFNQYNGTTRVCLARLATAPNGAPSLLGNISTRLGVETGDNNLIGGFIVTGTQPKKVIVRAIGPSLSSSFPGALADPVLELRDSSGGLIRSNDNWRSDQEAEIIATGIPPSNDLESAIVATLTANNSAYTAIVRGVNNGTGIGLVEAYDLDRTVDSKLANISTRGFVQTGDNLLIGGLIVLGQNPLRVVVRAIGPSLPLPEALADPTLELHNGEGTLIVANDNWRSDQEAEIIATTIPPSNDLESAIVRAFAPGNYTAIVRGVGGSTGVALVEVYGLNSSGADEILQ